MSKVYAIGLSDIRLKLETPPVGTVAEVDTLTITSGATSSGNITITLDGVAYPVAVTALDTPAEIGDKIRLEDFVGWTVTGVDEEVIFTANDEMVRLAPTFSGGATGVVASFVRTVLGEGFDFGVLTTVGEVAENSTQFVQEAPAETKFKGDYNDVTLFTQFQNGDITLETDIIEVNGAKMSALTGATWDSVTKTASLPESAPLIYAEAQLLFDVGFEAIKIYRGQVIAYLMGANLKTEMFKVHLKVTAVPTESGDYVDVVTEA